MLKDLRTFRQSSSSSRAPTPETNNENLPPVDPCDSSSSRLESDPSRPPLLAIQEPVQNPKIGFDQGAILRGKPEATTSKNHTKGSDSPGLPFRTPERMVARHRLSLCPKSQPGVIGRETDDDSSYRGPGNQFPPLSRGGRLGLGDEHGLTTTLTSKTAAKASSVQSDCSSTQGTPTKSAIRLANYGFGKSRPPISAGTRTMSLGVTSRPTQISSIPPVVDSVEVPHFELQEDPSFWMDNNVQVAIRVRPLNSTEKSLQDFRRCLKQESAHNITWIGQPETRFTFDYVACETINQEMLFRVAGLPMVENCMSGYNSCVFAYGQTGSGKTYTMLGEIGELEVEPNLNRGIIPRIFEFLFARIKVEEESRRDEKLKYSCKCSFLEIYSEQINDLLVPSSSNLLLREDIRKGVYVENLTEYVVKNVNDILKLLRLGAANRKVAATNMNRESSRSHSVFTCTIESRWEKDLTVNSRFAKLNLVDLAGSERQKTSGAEGERLKEAANINKSLSTLGHVIMVLADMAHGKQRHVPYRDSKLTFLLQDSLGGNSKTMIIANVSPSICSANETLSTLKFARRARLIQNNAVINEDASEDVIALRHQIRLLKEELSVLKRQNVSRSLSFRSAIFEDSKGEFCDASAIEKLPEVTKTNADELQTDGLNSLKSLESILAGALRREKMADTTIKQLEAEIKQLNCLVHQREEESRSNKMMLKFQEDKIFRLEKLSECQVPIDSYLLEEKHALSEEVQLLCARVDSNPEVTRFALENVRLLDQLQRFQDFYGGEREYLLAEVSELRNKLMRVLDAKAELHNLQKSDMETQLIETYQELESCRCDLQSCLERNQRLTRETSNLHVELKNCSSADSYQYISAAHQKNELLSESSQTDSQVCEKRIECSHEHVMKHKEEILNLQLELDILKIILAEEKSSRTEVEESANYTNNELKSANRRVLYMSKQYEDIKNELKDARSIIERLKLENILLVNEMEDAKKKSNQQVELLKKKVQEISLLRSQLDSPSSEVEKLSLLQEELKGVPSEHHENADFHLQMKLRRMQASLEKARDLNISFQSDQVSQTSLEQEMEEIRRQVEIETAEAIICLQEELVVLQNQADGSKRNESITKQSLMALETKLKELQIQLCLVMQENKKLGDLVKEKDRELRSLTEDWERLAYDIADVLADGNTSLEEATDQVVSISDCFPQRSWIGEQVGRMIRSLSERDLVIEELQKCLEEAYNTRCDIEWKLRSLRGATLAIYEAQQLENNEKEKEILRLTSEITDKMFNINQLENRIKDNDEQIKKAQLRATVAFVTVNKLSEKNKAHLQEIEHVKFLLDESKEVVSEKDTLLSHQISLRADAEKKIQDLSTQLVQYQDHIAELLKISQNQERAQELEQLKKEEDVVLTAEAENFPEVKRTIDEFTCTSDSSGNVDGPAEVQSSEKYTSGSAYYIAKDHVI
ncbi:kinesin-like protein KIN-12F [Musa acuminata AAA Group]|uniref:kinesin-like protein KIN-12F n=1 Tax=Musa acuminata AAA Group TaxID=214697 RepID=UPI0031DD6110